MPKGQDSQNTSTLNGFNYLPARLHEYDKDDWQIEYYIQNPVTNRLERKRIRVNKILKQYKNRRDARAHIDSIIFSINSKLFSGWNPFFEGEDARLYVKMGDVVDAYLAEKTKELRKDTIRSYSSVCSIFMAWVNRNNASLFCSMFNKGWAVRFMDYVYGERNVSQRSYNNYIKHLRCFFEWTTEKGYSKENPFVGMKLKRKEAKTRIIIDPDTRKKIMGQLNGSPFLLVCMLVYHSLIRPKEIRNIKVGDIDMTAHAIRISGEVAKNHNARYAAMSAQIENLITELKILKNPKDWYIFSDRETMKPGTVILYDAKFTKEFAKLRKLLNLDPKMQLYSFRDTGIFEMLKAGIDDLSVMQHADHSSLDITTIYANHYDPKLNERIRAKAPEF